MELLHRELDKNLRDKFELTLEGDMVYRDRHGNYIIPAVEEAWENFLQHVFEESVEGMKDIIDIANTMFIHAKEFVPNDSHVELSKNFQASCSNNFVLTIKTYVETLIHKTKGIISKGSSVNRPAGLYEKYRVTRIDGGVDPEDSEYFVLRLNTGSQHELKGLEAFADSVSKDYPELSKDLFKRADFYRTIFSLKRDLNDLQVMDLMCGRNVPNSIYACPTSTNLDSVNITKKNGLITIGCEPFLAEKLRAGKVFGSLYLMDVEEFNKVKEGR